MTTPAATVHGSAVLAGRRAVLIRGAAGSGKSRLALALLTAAADGRLRFARLVADDRIHVEAHHGRLLLRPPAALEGLIEVRGLGIRRLPFEPVAVAGLVVDLGAADGDRLPASEAQSVEVDGVRLPRLPFVAGADALPAVLLALHDLP